MAAIITEKFRLHNASQFVESFSETAANVYYLFLESQVPFPLQHQGVIVLTDTSGCSGQTEYYSWDLMCAKKITSSDITRASRRNFATEQHLICMNIHSSTTPQRLVHQICTTQLFISHI